MNKRGHGSFVCHQREMSQLDPLSLGNSIQRQKSRLCYRRFVGRARLIKLCYSFAPEALEDGD